MGVARAAVQQPMVTARGAGCEIETLDKERLQPAHGAVACGAGAGSATADHDDIIFFCLSVFHSGLKFFYAYNIGGASPV